MKKSIAPLLFGIAFVLAGLGYLGAVIFGWDFTVFFDGWWTLFIIVPALISILANGPRGFSVCALLIGVVLLLSEQDIIRGRYAWIAIVAVVIISIGISLIAGYFRGPKMPPAYTYNTAPDGNTGYAADPAQTGGNYGGDPTDFPNYNAILSGVDVRNTSTDFKGARASAILGGVDLDLRSAVLHEDVTVYLTAIMGGIDIYAPQNVRISVSKTDILGETDCKAYTMPADAEVPVVHFVCTTVMGGIEIK